MKDRIRKLRKSLDLTQKDFAERIGMKSNTIATYEMGRAIPSDPTINNICKEFGVNETWLRTGEGEMFVPTSTSALDALASKYPNMTQDTYVLIEKLLGLSASDQNVIMGFLKDVVKGFGDKATILGTLSEQSRDTLQPGQDVQNEQKKGDA
jgi:transcriptional regulator with XRE-family HTH domain